MNRAGLLLIPLLTLASGALVSPASAASTGAARVVGTTLEFRAGSGRANAVVISRSGRTVTVDDRVTIKAGKGCKKVKGDKTKVRCTLTLRKIVAGLGDHNDAFTNRAGAVLVISGGTGDDEIIGGPAADRISGEVGNDDLSGLGGNDVIDGGRGADEVRGGYGDDRVLGSSGDDNVTGGSGNDRVDGGADNDELAGDREAWFAPFRAGADVIIGGSGIDSVNYSYRRGPVTVSLGGRAGDDGEAGERDTVGADVENLLGTPGGDTLTGSAGANLIHGRGGPDAISGLAGNDRLETGGDGGDRVAGGDGDDVITAGNQIIGGAPDQVDGGAGTDLCFIDIDKDGAAGCERFTS